MQEKSKLFVVLSLHRAGSSATSGVLYNMGIHLGENLMGASSDNIKGHFENLDFVLVNDYILNSTGYSWRNPPKHGILEKKITSWIRYRYWKDIRYRGRTLDYGIQENLPMEEVITNFIKKNSRAVWGLKDPRMVLTYELWRPHLEKVADITYIFVHRPFESSVKSLAKREGFSLDTARTILTPYLIKLYKMRHTSNLNCTDIIDVYYNEILQNSLPFIEKINQRLGQPAHSYLKEVEQFLDPSLRHF